MPIIAANDKLFLSWEILQLHEYSNSMARTYHQLKKIDSEDHWHDPHVNLPQDALSFC